MCPKLHFDPTIPPIYLSIYYPCVSASYRKLDTGCGSYSLKITVVLAHLAAFISLCHFLVTAKHKSREIFNISDTLGLCVGILRVSGR